MALRFYVEHVSNYRRSYGALNSVVMLLLWLYVSNGAILLGGEMNSEIEKAGAPGTDSMEPTGPGDSAARDRSGS